MKPFKFSMSFALYAAMLGALVHLLERSSGTLERKARKIGNWMAAGFWVEIFFLDFQAMRGMQVHFNFRTVFDAVIYESVGAIAMATVVLHVLLVAVVLKKRAATPPVLLALKTGTAMLVASSFVGIFMAFPKTPEGYSGDVVGAHFIGTDVNHAVIPLIYWSAEGGDLRVSHFIGLHAFQLLPLAAMFFSRWVDRRMVWVLSAGYAGVFLISFFQALAGESLFRPSAATLAALGVTALGTAIGAFWARRNPSDPPAPPAPERASESVSANL
jgi:hypothetical protein